MLGGGGGEQLSGLVTKVSCTIFFQFGTAGIINCLTVPPPLQCPIYTSVRDYSVVITLPVIHVLEITGVSPTGL